MNTEAAVQVFQRQFLGSEDPQLARDLASIAHVRTIDRKDILFLEGEDGDTVYFLISGTVKLSRTSPDGKEAIIHFVQAGELFAEILFFVGGKYPVTATALDPCVLLGISATGMRRLVRENPDFSIRLIGLLSRRLKYLVGQVEQLANADVRRRFLAWLERMVETRGTTFELPVPKGELATLLGTTPETFSRLLKKLTDEGIIARDGKTLTVLAGPLVDEEPDQP